jgi:vacuolar-type H+-ATPase subunit B/Vma2
MIEWSKMPNVTKITAHTRVRKEISIVVSEVPFRRDFRGLMVKNLLSMFVCKVIFVNNEMF